MQLNYHMKQAHILPTGHAVQSIFLLHGLFGNFTNLMTLAKALQENYDVILVDLRNHGRSQHNETMSYPEMAGDIFELANSLGINTFSIVGHSMGGKVAMSCALEKPHRIEKIVVVDIAPVTYPDHHSHVFNGLMNMELANINSRQDADLQLSHSINSVDLRQFLLKSLNKNGGLFEFLFNLKQLKKNYSNIRGWPYNNKQFIHPTLFIKGANSDYITSEYQKPTIMQFPNAQVKIIVNAGHWVHAQKSQIFNRLVKAFFNH
ncbi:MAG: alpha/beta fold hydrolase [Psychromonas sp.]|nr:alpha/beta fold hydrolase [Psychromonas sp.]